MLMAAQKNGYQQVLFQPDPTLDVYLIMGLDPMAFFKQFYSERKTYTKNTWFVYSDNAYAYEPATDSWFSFDGSRMESCISHDMAQKYFDDLLDSAFTQTVKATWFVPN